MENTITNGVKSITREEVIHLPAYAAGMTIEQAKAKLSTDSVINLSVNENPLGISPKVLQAIENALQTSVLYPDSASLSLKQKIAVSLNVSVEQVVIGNGSEDILSMICKTFITPGAQVLLAKPTFSLYSIYTCMMGGEIISVPMDNSMSYRIDDWLGTVAANPNLRILMLANPSNPVGCIFNEDEFVDLIAACPSDTLLVIDEAYYEFASDSGAYPNSLNILKDQNRPWVVLRTFSKAYGLAGLRVGYAVVSEPSIIRLFDRVRTPYNVNRLGQVAAMAVMDDFDYLELTKKLICTQREMMQNQLQAMGFFSACSRSNFLFIDVQRESLVVAEALMRRGVMVKPWTEPGYNNYIRTSIGTYEQNIRFLYELKNLL